MPKSVESDQMLIHAYLGGEEEALHILIKRHQRKVFSFIVLKLKDRYLANDIFQETFIKVIDCLRNGNYKEEGKFLPWTLRIAHNLCFDHFRKLKRNPTIIDHNGDDFFSTLLFFEENDEEKLVKKQTSLTIKNLVSRLPDEQKEIVILRHYADLSFKEISEITGLSINTALGRMRYALKNLRKMTSESLVNV